MSMILDEAFQILENSPLSSLSLGSKELFHSNFLWWFVKQNPVQGGVIFGDFIERNRGQAIAKPPLREKENIDLRLTFADGQELIIENKVKSLPYKQQLESYAKKTPNSSHLLLTFEEPEFLKSLDPSWAFLSYSDLSDRMHSHLSEIQDPYQRCLVADYVDFVRALAEIDKGTAINFESDDYSFPLSAKLAELRLNDFYLKKKYEKIAIETHRRLVALFSDDQVKLNISPADPSVRLGDFIVNTGFSRSQGLLDVFVKLTDDVMLGVQLQAGQYRLIVCSIRDPRNCEVTARDLGNAWFDFSRFGEAIREYPKAGEFNKYGERFLYRRVQVDQPYKVGQLIQYMINDAMRARGFLKR